MFKIEELPKTQTIPMELFTQSQLMTFKLVSGIGVDFKAEIIFTVQNMILKMLCDGKSEVDIQLDLDAIAQSVSSDMEC